MIMNPIADDDDRKHHFTDVVAALKVIWKSMFSEGILYPVRRFSILYIVC